ncbi:MAG: serine/threonine protein kinase [Labilithrix sp.]|nr:serine/threonine protein kinase [Labilithrix sp.]
MDSSLPVLVTRLPDRRALAKLLRAALRHEIAQVPLTEAPTHGAHTLSLRVSGAPDVALLAEPMGAPKNGEFPLRLRPLHRAQAAELYALLEADGAAEPAPAGARAPQTPRVEPAPAGDSAPIARAMSGLAPPPALVVGPAIDPKVTARLEWPRDAPRAPRGDDPRRTAPSPRWATQPVETRREDPRKWEPPPEPGPDPRAIDDPRRTTRSASWAPAAPPPSGADADDPSLSVSVVFEPDALPEAVIAATQAAVAAARADATATLQEDDSPADSDGPSLSVSVIFEPDRALVDDDGPEIEIAAEEDIDDIDEVISEQPPTPTVAAEAPPMSDRGPAPAADDFFFDEALASLPMGEDGARTSDVPPTEGGAPVFTPRSAEQLAVDPTLTAPAAPMPPPDDDDDDADTLIRLPGPQDAERPRGPLPAAGRAAEELTPTENALPPKAETGGRKRKTTRRGKPKSKRHGSQGDARAFADDTTEATVDRGVKEEERRSKPPAELARDPLVGRKIADGKYLIDALIGAGAAGAVYKATHKELRRTVGVKVLHPHYQQDPHFMKSFRGEALAASQLDHPNVMRVLDFGQEPDGLVYIVMEFLSGRTLQNLLDEERRLQPERAVEILIQVCAALSVAHDNGIIHRDIKPDNIMLVPSRNDEGATFELVKVCDFGIAALQKRRGPGGEEDAEPSLYDNMNIIAGTPEYMSPEQARGTEIDARSDVYACGICLYELVTGRPPFLGENAAEILIKQLEEPPRPPSQLVRGLDPIVEEIILRAIQKDPQKRHQSARELRVELKESIDPGEPGGPHDDDERSIVENVPVLDDPASGFPAFFIAFSSAILRFGRFERGHPEASQALKELVKATRSALRGRRELTFARRDAGKTIGFSAVTGHGEIADLRRLLGSQLYGSFGDPFTEAITRKGVAAITLREGLPETELHYIIEMLLGPHAHDELRKELLSKPLRHVSMLFVADVVGRDRKLSWKVGLCAARLARDLKALSNVRGISLKKMREIREDLVSGVALLLTRGEEVRQFVFNADLVDDAVANLRGFSGFQVAPLVFERVLHEPAVETVALLLADFERGELDRGVLKGYLRAFGMRLLGERSPKSDAVVAELYRRSIVTDVDMPRDLVEQIRAHSLADALVREPSQFLRTLDFIQTPPDYAREISTLEAAMAVLARRAEAGALLAAISVLARHAKGSAGKPGPRETSALAAMKSMIDKQRLIPIANALLVGPNHQREAARQLLVLAGSAGAHALYSAREGLKDPAGRPLFVKVFRETGPAGWSLLSAVLPRMEVQNETDIAFVEDLLRAMPDRQDPALGEAVAKFLAHPRLRPAALAAIVPLWGERARKPLMDALEFAEEPARIVAVTELRRLRGIDEQAVNVIERLLTMKGSASEELRAAAAAALADVGAGMRARALALLSKGVEGKRGLVAMLRGDGSGEESLVVTEAMARALLSLDRAEGVRALKARLSKSEGLARQRLAALLQQA